MAEFDQIKHHELPSITPNHEKFKGANTLNDYLIKIKFDKLIYELVHLNNTLKEHYLDSISSIVYHSGKLPLEPSENVKLLNEMAELTQNLLYRLDQYDLNDVKKTAVFRKLINYLREDNKWLSVDDFRPPPPESKFWSSAQVQEGISKAKTGILELYCSGQKKQKHRNGRLPTSGFMLLIRKYLKVNFFPLDDILEMVIVLPFSGTFSLSKSEKGKPIASGENMVLLDAKPDSILPEMELSMNNFKGYLVLFSSAGLFELDSISSKNRSREDLTEDLTKCQHQYQISDLIGKMEGLKGVGTTHKDNIEQGILKIYEEKFLDHCTESPNRNWKVSLIEFLELEGETRIRTLYKHDGLELIIPLNKQPFKAEKCGLRSSEIDQNDFIEQDVNIKDVYSDIYNLENSESEYYPIVIFDPNIPHALEQLKNLQSVFTFI